MARINNYTIQNSAPSDNLVDSMESIKKEKALTPDIKNLNISSAASVPYIIPKNWGDSQYDSNIFDLVI